MLPIISGGAYHKANKNWYISLIIIKQLQGLSSGVNCFHILPSLKTTIVLN